MFSLEITEGSGGEETYNLPNFSQCNLHKHGAHTPVPIDISVNETLITESRKCLRILVDSFTI
jgi:hypothetical protein